jgi:hypothetical protein
VLPPAEFRDDGRGRLPAPSLDRLGPLTAAVVVGDAIQSGHDQDAVRPRVARIEVIGRTGAEPLDPSDVDVVAEILEEHYTTYADEEVPFPYVMQTLVRRWLERNSL